MRNIFNAIKLNMLFIIFFFCSMNIFSQSMDSALTVNRNNSLLHMEATISILSVNNIAIYKPFTISNNNYVNINILTGINFGFGNPFDLNSFFSKDHRRDLEYDLLIRGNLHIYKAFFIGIESGVTYKYLATNTQYHGRKWNEKIGLIITYKMNDSWCLIARASGTFKEASTFGIGAQFNF